MKRSLEQLGDRTGLVMTLEMLDYLGVTNEIEVTFENGRIILASPTVTETPAFASQELASLATPGRRMSFEEATSFTMTEYEGVLRRLAE